MEIHKILESLKDFEPMPIAETGLPAYIQTHKMIKPRQKRFFPACLYVGYVSDLPQRLDTKEVSNLICIDDTPFPADFLKSGDMNLYLLPAGTNQFDVLNRVADIMIDEATIVSSMRRILDTLYLNTGLQDLVDTAYEVFENPMFINDTTYKIIAMSYKPTFENETLEEEKKLGFVHEVNIASMKRDGLIEKSRNTNGIVFSQRSDKNERWLIKTVKLHDIAVADIALVDANRPFRELDYELLERFSKIVAIEMEKNDFYKDSKDVMYSYFLADLLSDKFQSQRMITQRARILNWKMYPWFQLVVIVDNKDSPFDERVSYIGYQLRQLIPDCRWTVYQNNFVMFISRPAKNITTRYERSVIEDFMRDNGLSAGISNVFTNLSEAARYYRQALHAVEVGIFISHGRGVFEYSDMLIFYAAQILTKRNDAREFLHPAIIEIQNYDEKYNTQLLQTLERYLFFVGDPTRTTQALHIHRNTLLYRINKIKELTGVDLDNGDERLKIQLYLKILEYQKGRW